VHLADRRARRSPAVWGWGCPSAVQLSKRMADDCGRARACPMAPSLNLSFLRAQTMDRDWIIRSVHNLWFGERASPGCLYLIAVRQGASPRLHANAGSLAIAASLTRTAGIKARHLAVRLSNFVLRGHPDCWSFRDIAWRVARQSRWRTRCGQRSIYSESTGRGETAGSTYSITR
jgi:hypothetical protein